MRWLLRGDEGAVGRGLIASLFHGVDHAGSDVRVEEVFPGLGRCKVGVLSCMVLVSTWCIRSGRLSTI